MALPGSMYLYQGEELGLPEVEDIPAERRQDPMFFRSNGVDPGRDGCRVPLPWSGDEPPYGFSPSGATRVPWLDQPAGWGALTVAAEDADPDSMLALYRAALRIRRDEPALGDGELQWRSSSEEVLSFTRGRDLLCVVNFGSEPVALPPGADLLIASAPLEGGRLPCDATAWLRLELHP
jgi:alpha-glucosidase